jgi:nitrogen fixation protein FixH
VVLSALATVVGLAPAASAAYGVEPVGPPPSWVPNGGIHSVVTDGARVYVGGSFTGGVAALDALTGQLIWQGSANNDVRALALGPNGQLLLGGAFTAVGGATHRSLASVSAATGAVNNTFKGAAGGTVRDIVVVGNTAYFGGAFVNHGGMAQQGLGAVDASTGALVDTFTASTDGPVYALGTNGSRLVFGGRFTSVNGLPRNQLASVALPSHSLDVWAPARACTNCNLIWDLTLDPGRNRVYTVGRNAGTLFTVDLTTGATVFRNVGSVNGDSQAVTLAPDGRVYVGGHFSTVAGQPRLLVAEFDVSGKTPVLGPFSTRFVTSYPGVWAMASTASRLYVGGDFTAAGSKVNNQNRYPYFAIFPAAGSAPPADTTAPTATVSPANAATNVPTTNNVTATFSEPVLGVSNTTFTLTDATGAAVSASVTGTGNEWVLDPAAELKPGTTYTVTLTGGTTAIRDNGNNVPSPNPTRTTFTTAAPPADTTAPTATVSPANAATNIATTNNVTATFSEPVVGVSNTTFTLTDAAGAPVSASVTGSGTQWVLDPDAALAPGTTYTVTLTGGTTAIRDNANNSLSPNPTRSTFTTAAATSGDAVAPTVTAFTPPNGRTGVSRSANPTATFSETVTNVTPTTFTLTRVSDGAAVLAREVRFNVTDGRWVFDPSPTLDPNTQYEARVTTGVTDSAGNHLAADVTWRFTTGA